MIVDCKVQRWHNKVLGLRFPTKQQDAWKTLPNLAMEKETSNHPPRPVCESLVRILCNHKVDRTNHLWDVERKVGMSQLCCRPLSHWAGGSCRFTPTPNEIDYANKYAANDCFALCPVAHKLEKGCACRGLRVNRMPMNMQVMHMLAHSTHPHLHFRARMETRLLKTRPCLHHFYFVCRNRAAPRFTSWKRQDSNGL